MILNSVCSVALLLTFGFFSGETKTVLEFPLKYHRHFHVGCIFSGVFGAIIMISYSKLCSLVPLPKVRFYNSIVMTFVAFVSVIIFRTTIAPLSMFFIIFGLAGVVLYSYLFSIQAVEEEDSKIKVSEKTLIL